MSSAQQLRPVDQIKILGSKPKAAKASSGKDFWVHLSKCDVHFWVHLWWRVQGQEWICVKHRKVMQASQKNILWPNLRIAQFQKCMVLPKKLQNDQNPKKIN